MPKTCTTPARLLTLSLALLLTTTVFAGKKRQDEPLNVIVKAKRAVLMDELTGKLLWSRNPEVAAYPASTTKIMTGLLLLEHTKPDDLIIAPKDVDKIPESSMHLKPNERIRARNLIYAIMLRSANDGCYAAACHISGSLQKFVELMNARAKEIGCTHTTFHNSNGLNDPMHKISAHDLALIAREAMKREDFRRVVATKKIKIERSLNFKDMWMVNKNKMLAKDNTADGVKTGWTIPSGHTYVGSVSRNGIRVFTSLLDTKDWQGDHKAMVDWAFKAFAHDLYRSPGPITAVELGTGAEKLGGELSIRQNVYNVHRVGDSRPVTTRFEPALVPPPTPNPVPDAVGLWIVTDADGFEQKVPVYSTGALQSVMNSMMQPQKDGRGLWIGAIIFASAAALWFRSRKVKANFEKGTGKKR